MYFQTYSQSVRVGHPGSNLGLLLFLILVDDLVDGSPYRLIIYIAYVVYNVYNMVHPLLILFFNNTDDTNIISRDTRMNNRQNIQYFYLFYKVALYWRAKSKITKIITGNITGIYKKNDFANGHVLVCMFCGLLWQSL